MPVDEQGLLLWREEEGVLGVVEISAPGRTERDTFSVCAVELIRSFMGMKVGCDVRLRILNLCFTSPFRIWRKIGKKPVTFFSSLRPGLDDVEIRD